MTATEPALAPTTGWTAICSVDRLTPDRGVAALVDGEPVAVFLLSDGSAHAIGNLDPFSGASVLSRGIVGDVAGTPTVASPIFKQRFDLRTGRSLDDEAVAVPTFAVRLVDGTCEVRTGDPRP
jgi:nitrite reductase (NADH) small subunit